MRLRSCEGCASETHRARVPKSLEPGKEVAQFREDGMRHVGEEPWMRPHCFKERLGMQRRL